MKAERKQLRELLHAVAPKAIETVSRSLDSANEKNRLRAGEIILAHSVPKLEEVTNDGSNPFIRIDPAQLPELIEALDRELAKRPPVDGGGPGAAA